MSNRRMALSSVSAMVALASAVIVAQGTGATRAHADIKGDGITGRLELVERKVGTGTVVDVTLNASGLKPGLHGVHLHAVGKCEPDFAAAGGHFDPGPAEQHRSGRQSSLPHGRYPEP